MIQSDAIPGKVLEGGDRSERFRKILTDLVNGEMTLEEAYWKVQTELPRKDSIHGSNNKVFPDRWTERLVRVQYSRFYNQAVLKQILDDGGTTCFIPHSEHEDLSSPCTAQLAGTGQSAELLYNRLVNSYQKGNWSNEVKIPNHPHCTHVVRPSA